MDRVDVLVFDNSRLLDAVGALRTRRPVVSNTDAVFGCSISCKVDVFDSKHTEIQSHMGPSSYAQIEQSLIGGRSPPSIRVAAKKLVSVDPRASGPTNGNPPWE